MGIHSKIASMWFQAKHLPRVGKELTKILTSISQAFLKLLNRPRLGLDQFIAKYGKFEKFDFPIPQFSKNHGYRVLLAIKNDFIL